MIKRLSQKILPLFITYLFVVCIGISNVYAQEDMHDSMQTEDINLVFGELTQIRVYSLTRLSMTNPDVADIIDADDDEILIIAKEVGQTVLFIWDENGKRPITINVSSQDLYSLKGRIDTLLKDAKIYNLKTKVNQDEGKIIISGELPEHKQILFDEIVITFSDDIINLVEEEEIEDLVQIDMEIFELSTTLQKALGFKWQGADADAGFTLNYEENLPSDLEGMSKFLKFGQFSRTDTLLATLDTLISEGKARILSQPRLVVKSGEEASFLVGGEIPVRTTTTSSGGSSQENVEFKEFGVGMTVTPEVRKNKIDLLVNMEVSSVDEANRSGDDVAFTTRSANTQLFIDDGQTIVLAGLIRQTESDTVDKVAFLGNIPVVGMLFRHRTTPKTDQELVISLTARRMFTSVEDKRKKMASENNTSRDEYVDRPTAFRTMIPRKKAIPGEMSEYVQSIQQKISQAVIYPREAKQFGWEGTVKLGLHILNDGTLAYALVKQSSGHEIIDDYALEAAQKIAPYSQFPPDTDLQELNVTIPIVYSLKRN